MPARALRSTLLATALTAASALPAPAQSERVLLVPLVENGSFDEATIPELPRRLPWWRPTSGRPRTVEGAGATWLVTAPGEAVGQPIPAYAPLLSRLEVRGRVRGRGQLSLLEGSGARAELELGGGEEPVEFAITGRDLAERLDRAPVPRLELELSAAPGSAGASWSGIEVRVAFPLPAEDALREEVLEHLHAALDPWLELSLDREGPRETAFAAHLFDAVTGERIDTLPCGLHPLFEALLAVPEELRTPRWSAALEAYVADFLALALHPGTGLPRLWDALRDEPLDDRGVEIAAPLGFLLDLADRGPARLREPALAAAARIGAVVLERGILPDGSVAPLYRPADGEPSLEVSRLRRLDLPAQMVRLAARTGEPRLASAARRALAQLELTHHWPGDWQEIDPGFDDDFGHYAARAALMLEADPGDALARRFVRQGFERYRAPWRDAMRFGGSMAADQVRCWHLLARFSALEPEILPELRPLLEDAVRSHLAGEQYSSGAWGDVTYYGFDPKRDLAVGDLPGLPANLLRGLALACEPRLGLDRERLLAIFTAVLRSSGESYRRPFGYLSTLREVAGHNHAGGSLRLAPALTEMLAQLE